MLFELDADGRLLLPLPLSPSASDADNVSPVDGEGKAVEVPRTSSDAHPRAALGRCTVLASVSALVARWIPLVAVGRPLMTLCLGGPLWPRRTPPVLTESFSTSQCRHCPPRPRLSLYRCGPAVAVHFHRPLPAARLAFLFTCLGLRDVTAAPAASHLLRTHGGMVREVSFAPLDRRWRGRPRRGADRPPRRLSRARLAPGRLPLPVPAALSPSPRRRRRGNGRGRSSPACDAPAGRRWWARRTWLHSFAPYPRLTTICPAGWLAVAFWRPATAPGASPAVVPRRVGAENPRRPPPGGRPARLAVGGAPLFPDRRRGRSAGEPPRLDRRRGAGWGGVAGDGRHLPNGECQHRRAIFLCMATRRCGNWSAPTIHCRGGGGGLHRHHHRR